jgi:hypothetical protein
MCRNREKYFPKPMNAFAFGVTIRHAAPADEGGSG